MAFKPERPIRPTRGLHHPDEFDSPRFANASISNFTNNEQPPAPEKDQEPCGGRKKTGSGGSPPPPPGLHRNDHKNKRPCFLFESARAPVSK